MAGKKSTSDEEIISAIITHRTFREAAESLGISPRTITARMRSREFRSLYLYAKTDLLRAATFSLADHLSEAVDVISEIRNDQSANPAIRLQAAHSLLSHAGKYSAKLTADEHDSRVEGEDPLDFSDLGFS